MARALQRPQSPLDKEGFLCPMCMQDLGDANSLAIHFENYHNTTSQDPTDVIDQVKGEYFCILTELQHLCSQSVTVTGKYIINNGL